LRLKPLTSEPELWLIWDESAQELCGILVVYVDDLMYLAEEETIEVMHAEIRSLWPTSTLEWLNQEKSVRYLGVEIKATPDGSYSINQQAYITELLRAHNLHSATHTQLPVPKEWIDNVEQGREAEEEFCERDLRRGQKGYSLLLSTAAIVDELQPGVYDRVLAVDNQSTVSMCAGGPGSQRTRHLKVRAEAIREAVAEHNLIIRYTPGEEQLADLATKLVPRERLWYLLRLWGFATSGLERVMNLLRLQMIAVVVALTSLVGPVDGAHHGVKKGFAVSGMDEILFLATLMCIAAIGLWELFKWSSRALWRQLKNCKRQSKLAKVREIAAQAAKEAVREEEDKKRPTTGIKDDLIHRLMPYLGVRNWVSCTWFSQWTVKSVGAEGCRYFSVGLIGGTRAERGGVDVALGGVFSEKNESSHGLYGKEQVMAEVSKQVRLAMEAHNREYRMLERENEMAIFQEPEEAVPIVEMRLVGNLMEDYLEASEGFEEMLLIIVKEMFKEERRSLVMEVSLCLATAGLMNDAGKNQVLKGMGMFIRGRAWLDRRRRSTTAR
ncbi:GIP, partial [Symbiodinium microadriaticum]